MGVAKTKNIKNDLKAKTNKNKAKILQKFFKTGPGEYGEGDIFLGVVVPETRKIAKKYYNEINLPEIQKLLNSKIHEERLCALLVLVEKFQKGNLKEKERIFKFYLKNTGNINNWDLIDLSADKIVGAYLLDKNKSILKNLAKSKNLWERRIAVLATFNFIKNNEFKPTLEIAKILLGDNQDLIQKAVGWMLREIGKRSLKTERDFLKKYAPKIPRIMLRYAIEKFPNHKRKKYLSK